MDADLGELLTRWTARLAVGCYVARIGIDASVKGPSHLRAARLWWTLGCTIYLLHVACAFYFYHAWSHQSAYEHTARETAAVTGIDWGGGLYFNYLFTLVWTADTLAWWIVGDKHLQRRRWYWTVQVYFAFMVLNATVVFGPGWWKGVGAIVVVALWLLRRRRNRLN